MPSITPASLPSSASSSTSGPSASASSSTSGPSASSSSSTSSAFRAHSIRAMATSIAFARNVPVSALLEAATWRSSVFTAFYLRDVQFEPAQGFSLGLVVAAGAVVKLGFFIG